MLDLQQPPVIYLLATFANILAGGAISSLRARRDRKWAREDMATGTSQVITKIEENTEISNKAFDAANNVNEKIATVTKTAAETASMVAAQVAQSAAEAALLSNQAVLKELKRISTYTGETRKLLTSHIEECQQRPVQ